MSGDIFVFTAKSRFPRLVLLEVPGESSAGKGLRVGSIGAVRRYISGKRDLGMVIRALVLLFGWVPESNEAETSSVASSDVI